MIELEAMQRQRFAMEDLNMREERDISYQKES